MYTLPCEITSIAIKNELRDALPVLFPNNSDGYKRTENLYVWKYRYAANGGVPKNGEKFNWSGRECLVLGFADVLIADESESPNLVDTFAKLFAKFPNGAALKKVVLFNPEVFKGYYVGVVLDEEYDNQKQAAKMPEPKAKKRTVYFNASHYTGCSVLVGAEDNRVFHNPPIMRPEDPNFMPCDATLVFGTETPTGCLYKIVGTNQFGHQVIYQQGFVSDKAEATKRLDAFIKRCSGKFEPQQPNTPEPTISDATPSDAEYLSKWSLGTLQRGFGWAGAFYSVQETFTTYTRTYHGETDGVPAIGDMTVWYEKGWFMKNTFYQQRAKHKILHKGRIIPKNDVAAALRAAETMLLSKINHVTNTIQTNLFA